MAGYFTSKKQIIKIGSFLEKYYEIRYDGINKLTHKELGFFMMVKGLKPIERLAYNDISKRAVDAGEVLLIMDEAHKVVPYYHPSHNINKVCCDIFQNNSYEQLQETRRKILEESHLTYNCFGDEVIESDSVTIHDNIEMNEEQIAFFELQKTNEDDNEIQSKFTKRLFRYGKRASYSK